MPASDEVSGHTARSLASTCLNVRLTFARPGRPSPLAEGMVLGLTAERGIVLASWGLEGNEIRTGWVERDGTGAGASESNLERTAQGEAWATETLTGNIALATSPSYLIARSMWCIPPHTVDS